MVCSLFFCCCDFGFCLSWCVSGPVSARGSPPFAGCTGKEHWTECRTPVSALLAISSVTLTYLGLICIKTRPLDSASSQALPAGTLSVTHARRHSGSCHMSQAGGGGALGGLGGCPQIRALHPHTMTSSLIPRTCREKPGGHRAVAPVA